MSAAARVAWYRLRTTFRRRRGGYLAVVVLLGLVGGLALGAVAAARRTQSSFPVYLASTHPPDLVGISAFVNPAPGAAGLGYDPVVVASIAHLPHVAAVGNEVGLNIIPLGRRGQPLSPAAYPASAGEASGFDGSAFFATGATALRGRIPPRSATGQFVVSATIARDFHFHLGEHVPFAAYTNAQTSSPDFGTARVVPHLRFEAELVGIVEQSTQVVQDDADASNNDNILAFTTARTAPLVACCAYYTGTEVDVAGGPRNVRRVQAEITALLPAGFSPFVAGPAAALEAKAERAIRPESIALGVFGAIAALAAVLIVAQVIGRQLRLDADELGTVRALGADPAMTLGDGLLGIVGAVVAGTVVAVVVAVALSPLSPLGPVGPVYPTPGVAFDWTVLGLGAAFLVVSLGTAGVLLAVRNAPHRAVTRRRRAPERASPLAGAAGRAGLPAVAVTGVRFALEPGGGADTVPVRSAILGAALALVVMIATVTFGSSLDTLVSHPALYGWNWNYELSASQGAVLPGARSAALLAHDRDVAAWSGIFFGSVRIDGLPAVPVIGERAGASVAPPVLSGHGVDAPDQIVMGTITLAQLHKHLGDHVTLRTGATAPARLRIVGTATMPTIGVGGNQHPEMGTGAIVATPVLPPTSDAGYSNLPGAAPGPEAILVRLSTEASPATGEHSLRRIAEATSTPADYGVVVIPVQRPAEIVNYRTMGSTPAVLGAALAAGAVAALGLTLVASVRRRRRDLALLKTLGFTGRQLAAVVAWQSTIAVAIGTVVGIPLGIVLGRALWDLFARQISAVPAPSVPTWSVVVIAAAALVLANVMAAVPGRMAARTPTGLLLREQ